MTSGRHVNVRRKITAEQARFDEMDRVARMHGLSWSQWALAVLLAAKSRALGADAEASRLTRQLRIKRAAPRMARSYK